MSGRELDAQVAERVMGWTEITHGPGCDCCVDTWEEWTGLPALKPGDDGRRFVPHPRCGQCGCRPDKYREFRVTTDARRSVPCYTTSFAAAFEVWEKLSSESPDGWAIFSTGLGAVTVEYFGEGYMGDREAGAGDFSIDGPFPRAVCEAALMKAERAS